MRVRTVSTIRVSGWDRLIPPAYAGGTDCCSRTKPLQSLGDERIPGCVAKDPEEDHQHEPGPKIDWRDEDAAIRLTGDRAFGKSQKSVDEERQSQDNQRIKLEGRNRVQMEQLVKRTSRATTRTLPSGDQAEGTLGEPLIRGAGRIEEKKEDGNGGQSDPNGRGRRQLSRSIWKSLDEIKTRHTADLQPAFPALDISTDEIFVRFCQIDDALDDANHVHDPGERAAAQHGDQQHGHTFFLITENEFVDAEATEDNSQNPGDHLFVRAQGLPIGN